MRIIIPLFLLLCILYKPVSSQIIPVEQRGKFIYVNTSGNRAFDRQFVEAAAFSSGLAAVRTGSHFEYINSRGITTIKPQFDLAFPFKGDYAVVGVDSQYFVINKLGRRIKGPYVYFPRVNQADRYLIIQENKKYGLIDSSAEWILEPKYISIRHEKSGYFLLEEKEGVFQFVGSNMKPLGDKHKNVQILHRDEREYLALQKRGDSSFFLISLRYGSARDIKPFNGESLVDSRILDQDLYYFPPQGEFIDPSFLKSDYVYNSGGNKLFPNMTLYLNKNWAKNHWVELGNKHFKMYSEYNVQGYEMFDEVIGRSETTKFDLVRREEKWSLYSPYNDKIHEVGEFDFVHPTAHLNHLFVFGIRDSIDGSQKWGIADVRGRIVAPAIYDDVDDQWQNNTLKCYRNDSLFLISKRGEVIYVNLVKMNAQTLNLNYKMRWDTRILNEGSYSEIKGPTRKLLEGGDDLKIAIEPMARPVGNSGNWHRVYLINKGKEDFQLEVQDNRVTLHIQAKIDGVWKDITHFEGSWCGNSYYFKSLKKGGYFQLNMPRFTGSVQTQVRLKWTIGTPEIGKGRVIYSRELSMGINPGQSWVSENFIPKNLGEYYPGLY